MRALFIALSVSVLLAGCETTLPTGIKSVATYFEADAESAALKRSLIDGRYQKAATQIVYLASEPNGLPRVTSALAGQPQSAVEDLVKALDGLPVRTSSPVWAYKDLGALAGLAEGPIPAAKGAFQRYRDALISAARSGSFPIDPQGGYEFQRDLRLSDREMLDTAIEIVISRAYSRPAIQEMMKLKTSPAFPLAMERLGSRLPERKWSKEELMPLGLLGVPGVENEVAKLEREKAEETERQRVEAQRKAEESAARERVTAFGFALGHRLDRTLRECPSASSSLAELSRVQTDYCSTLGEVSGRSSPGDKYLRKPPFGGPVRIPQWVERDVTLSLGRDGVVEGVRVYTSGPNRQGLVLDAIAERFGPPATRDVRTARNAMGATWEVVRATWEAGGLHVSHDWFAIDKCTVEIYTPAGLAARAKRLEEFKKKNAL